MLRQFKINNLHSKQILDYCRNSTQESIKRIEENFKNTHLNNLISLDYENPNSNNNHNIIFGIIMVLSVSSYIFYRNKQIK
jgi:hypothetical protein